MQNDNDQGQSPSQLKWEGRWDQLAGKVKQLWSNVTDDDIKRSEGRYRELVGIIKEKTGKSDEDIERQLNQG